MVALSLAVVVKSHVLAVLEDQGYDRKKTAELLGISSRTVDIWLSTWGLNRPPYRKAGRGMKRKNKTNQVRIPARCFLEAQ